MTTTNVSTIGSGGTYADPFLWESATDYGLVVADVIEEGQVTEDLDLTASALQILGATVSAAAFRRLTHDGTSYSHATGAGYLITSSATWRTGLVSDDYTEVVGLGFENTYATSGNGLEIDAANCLVDGVTGIKEVGAGAAANCLREINGSSGAASGNVLRNCVAVGDGVAATSLTAVSSLGGDAKVLNCVAYGSGFRGFSTWVATPLAGKEISNCIAVDCTADFVASGAGATYSNNISSDATAPGADSHINIAADDVFRYAAGNNFQILENSAARDAGLALLSTDITGAARVDSDIGAYQWVAAPENVSTIGTGGSYADPHLWESATDNDLKIGDLSHTGKLVDIQTVISGVSLSGALASYDCRRTLTHDGAPYDPVAGTGSGVTCAVMQAVQVVEDYARVDGILAESTVPTEWGYGIQAQGKGNEFLNCTFLRTADLAAGSGYAVRIFSTASGVAVRNCLIKIYGSGGGSHAFLDMTADSELSNCTVIGNQGGAVYYSTATRTAESITRNVSAYTPSVFNAFIPGTGTPTESNNVSDDTSAPGTNSLINQVAADLFEDPANNDFRPKAGSNLLSAGLDLSADFTTDIEGRSRDGLWDIGAYIGLFYQEDTIGTGGSYADPFLWESATDVNRVFLKTEARGRLLSETFNLSGYLSLSGATNSESYHRVLTYDSAPWDNATQTGALLTAVNDDVAQVNELYSGLEGIALRRTAPDGDYDHVVNLQKLGCYLDSVSILVTGVTAPSNGIGAILREGTFARNCAFVCDGAGNDMLGVYFKGGATTSLRNSTVSGWDGGVRWESAVGDVTVSNVVSSGNTNNYSGAVAGNVNAASSNNISGDATAPGTSPLINQVATDLFTDPANNDFTLKQGSAAINAGTDLSASGVLTDITGTPRTGPWDIGAYLGWVEDSKTIGAAGDYADPFLWESATDVDNVVIGERKIGKMMESFVIKLSLSGGEGDQTYGRTLTHNGTPYNHATGEGPLISGTSEWQQVIAHTEHGVRFIGFGVRNDYDGATASHALQGYQSSHVLVDGCTAIRGAGATDGGYGITVGGGVVTGNVVRNCLAINEGAVTGYGISTYLVQNCTAYNFGGRGIEGTEIRNCLSVNNGTDFGNPSVAANNISSDATAPGPDSLINQTAASLFVDAANGDFRLPATSPAINVGLDLSASFNTDLRGFARNGLWDIGAYEMETMVVSFAAPTVDVPDPVQSSPSSMVAALASIGAISVPNPLQAGPATITPVPTAPGAVSSPNILQESAGTMALAVTQLGVATPSDTPLSVLATMEAVPTLLGALVVLAGRHLENSFVVASRVSALQTLFATGLGAILVNETGLGTKHNWTGTEAFVSDITPGAIVDRINNIPDAAVSANATLSCSDFSLTNTTANDPTTEAIYFFGIGEGDNSSRLILRISIATGLPFVPDGNVINILCSSGLLRI